MANRIDPPDIYPPPGWVWQYPQPKNNVTFAHPFVLGLVEFFHFVLFPIQLGVAYVFYHYPIDRPVASIFWLIMAPIFQILAGFALIVTHEYEGWQVAPFVSQPPDRGQNNNGRLREVAYKLLFVYQAVAAIMFTIGVFGVNKWSLNNYFTVEYPWTFIIVFLLLLWLYIASRTPLPSCYIHGNLVFPVPIPILVPFIITMVFYALALWYIYGGVVGLTVAVLSIFGGLTEAFLAESTFNQLWHLAAVVLLGCAGMVQILFFWIGTIPNFLLILLSIFVVILVIFAIKDLFYGIAEP